MPSKFTAAELINPNNWEFVRKPENKLPNQSLQFFFWRAGWNDGLTFIPTGEPIEFLECDDLEELQGTEAWTAFKIGETIYRLAYTYHSYSGYDYPGYLDRNYIDLTIVEPREKTITVYEFKERV